MDARDQFQLFAKLYGTGAVAGPLRFQDLALSDLEGTLRWVKPARKSGLFKTGFSVDVRALGSTPGSLNDSLFQPRDEQTQANARLRFFGGDLPAPIEQPVTVSGSLYRLASAPASFSLRNSPDGLFTGSFLDPASGKVARFRGVIVGKAQRAAGFFLGAGTAGGVELIPGYR